MDLLAFDRQLFLSVNQTSLHGPVADALMILISSHALWVILLTGLVIQAVRTRDRRLWVLVMTLAVAVATADSFCAYILKPWIARPRPCHELASVILPTGRCGGAFGFPSNHAVNAGVVTAVLFQFTDVTGRKAMTYFAAVALLVCFSRVWLGVHYPGDVIAGLSIGAIVGTFAGRFTRKKFL